MPILRRKKASVVPSNCSRRPWTSSILMCYSAKQYMVCMTFPTRQEIRLMRFEGIEQTFKPLFNSLTLSLGAEQQQALHAIVQTAQNGGENLKPSPLPHH